MEITVLNQLKRQFGIVGNASALNRAIEVAALVAPTDLSVLITGESGVGKESFSKLIHGLSVYKYGKFIAVNCGAIPDGTIDSELFGHEKGAFTGATEARKGYFEEANGGTIFLDEIGDMPLAAQIKLLRVLEYGEFMRVGSSKIQKTKVRVVAATNLDLQKAIHTGSFREDLYYRLNTVPLFIPPLRQRGDDVLLLFTKFATEISDHYYSKLLQLKPEAQELLLRYRFPGNIRQLKNLVEQLAVLEVDRIVDEPTLKNYLPSIQEQLPGLYDKKNVKESLGDAEILYKLFFDLKKDMQDLKNLVFDFLTDHVKNRDITKSLSVGNDKEYQAYVPASDYLSTVLEKKMEANYNDATPVDLASLADKQREMILETLIKFNNNRKKTAQALGISERTLYRKIDQYEVGK